MVDAKTATCLHWRVKEIEMGFIIRSGFWFSLVLLGLPLSNVMPNGERAAGPIETLMAAKEAFNDLSGICERKPGVCETGRLAVNTVGVRAKEAARVAYQVLDENFGDAGVDAGPVGTTVVKTSSSTH